MIRRYLYPLMTSVAIATLVACGGGNSTPDASTPTPPSPPPSTSEQSLSASEALRELETAGEIPTFDNSPTIPGPDTDSNGVRDDIDTYIDGQPDTDSQKAALRALSRAITAAMASAPSDEGALRSATSQINHAVACIWSQYPSNIASSKVEEMQKFTVNTRDRFNAYMKYNNAVDGTVITLPRGARCD